MLSFKELFEKEAFYVDKGLTNEEARKLTIGKIKKDHRGFAYNPKTGKCVYMKSFIETEEDLIEEGKISSAFSTGVALYITKMLVTTWKKHDAFKFGLIDDKGKRTEKEAITSEEKQSLNLLNQFIIGLRRLLLTFMSEGILKVLMTVYVTKNILKK